MNSVKDAWGIRGPATSRQDWFSALQPMARFARIIGIFPFSLKGPVGERKYSTNVASLIYSAVVFVLMITILVTLYFIIDYQIIQHSVVVKAITRAETVLQILLMVSVFAPIILAKEKIANTINNMCAQNEALRKLGIRFDYAAEFKRSCIRFAVILSTIVVLCIYNFFDLFEQNFRHPVIWMFYMSTRSLNILSTCLFTELILALKQNLTAINEDLRRMIEETKNSPLQTIFMRFKTCERIRSTARIHGDLFKSASSLNQIFGIEMVLKIILVLVLSTWSFYFVIRELRDSHRSVLGITVNVVPTMSSFADTIYILWACIGAQNQATLTGKLIHKLNVNEADTVLHTAIQNFSLQLFHEKLVFSGAGLFPLDATLIQSIVGAVTTYLVIMLQFDTTTS